MRAYRGVMVAGAYVNVPEELGESLIIDGFRKAGVERGVDVGWALSAGANAVTILSLAMKSRDSSPTFGRARGDGARRRPADPGRR